MTSARAGPSALAVRVVAADLAVDPADAARLAATLPASERGVSATREVARAIARSLVGEMLGCDPAAVPIVRTCEHCGHAEHGRPRIAGGAVSLSLSHAGAVALVALVPGDRRIGVDVEVVARRPRLDALAARVLSAHEHAAWLQLPADEQLPAFLRAWTAREAVLKATGVGVTTRLRDVEVAPDGWTCVALDGPPGTIAALAVDAPATVAYETWRLPARERHAAETEVPR